jgi:hypothetical protein
MKALTAKSAIRSRSSKEASRTEMAVLLKGLFKIEQSWSELVEDETLCLPRSPLFIGSFPGYSPYSG